MEREHPDPAETCLLDGPGGKEKVPVETVGRCPWSSKASHPSRPAAGWFEVLEQLGMSLELVVELLHHCLPWNPLVRGGEQLCREGPGEPGMKDWP